MTDVDLARRVFSTLEQTQHVIYLQQFIHQVDDDVRLFVVGGNVIAAMKRVGDDWRKNISRGASGQMFTPDEAMCKIAVKAAAACGADVAGVDLLRVEHTGDDGAVGGDGLGSPSYILLSIFRDLTNIGICILARSDCGRCPI